MHIGSSSSMPTTSPDAPLATSMSLYAQNAEGSFVDWVFSGTLQRFPKIKIAYAEMITQMRGGSVLVDVAIDQGGCFETSRPTTHSEPTYLFDDVVHYCVANMPGAVPKTSTYALNNATLPFTLAIADKGVSEALRDDVHLRSGLNVHRGLLTEQQVADAQGLDYTDPLVALG
jgi:alanine dehydrogenase